MKLNGFAKIALALALSLVGTAAPAQEQGAPASAALQRRSDRPNALRSGLLNRRNRNQPNRLQPQGGAAARPPALEHPNDAKTVEAGGRSIEFNAAPLEMVFKVYSELKERTVLKDPATPAATITLQPLQGQDLTDEEKIWAIETVLEMNGIHLEPYGEKFMRAIPRKEVRKDGIPLIMDPDAELRESTTVVSLMLPFKNISIEEAQKALEGFKSGSGVLNVFERTNAILITDTESNINRMREIARSIDIATPVTENVFVRQVRNAAAADIKTALEAIVQESQKELEKNGKQPQTAPTTTYVPGSLLRRPGPAKAEPVNNASVVTAVSDADRGMIRGKVLILADERSNKLIIVTSKSNMDFFDKVIEELDIETTPDTVVKVYRLKYAEAEDVSDMINDLIGNAPTSKNSGKSNPNPASKSGTASRGNLTSGVTTAARKSANQRSGDAKAGELSKENTTVLADKRINGLVVMTNKELVPVVESIIESMDIKLSQVLIETVIVEIGLGDGLDTGIDWIQNGRLEQQKAQTDAAGNTRYRVYTKAEETVDDDGNVKVTPGRYVESLSENEYAAKYGDSEGYTLSKLPAMAFGVVKDTLWTGSSSYMQQFGGGGSGGAQAAEVVLGTATNLLGGGISYIFKSDNLNLSAVLQASQTDSRSKYLASPIVMTVDNKEATVEATEMKYLFKGYQYSGSTYNGTAVPDYEQKEIGITLKMTPKINPNGTIMLTVEEEYSQEGAGQKITGTNGQSMDAATTVTRKMSADILLENMQTAVLGGLTTTYTKESTSGIPWLMDIPWIGKWLFSKVSQKESRSELLIFMQPYVLDDGAVTQAEAIRRKRSLSDSRPWDDHGWSLSELADPVSKKEQMRRLKDEWKKQDEERRTKIAIEGEKIRRVKALQQMSKEERDMWLTMHKDELEDEAKDALEKKMLDKDSQEDLRKLAASIREKKLAEADAVIKEADAAAKAENERGKLEAEKAAEEAGKKRNSEVSGKAPAETPREEKSGTMIEAMVEQLDASKPTESAAAQ